MHCKLFNLFTQLKIFLRRVPLSDISFKTVLEIHLREGQGNLFWLVWRCTKWNNSSEQSVIKKTKILEVEKVRKICHYPSDGLVRKNAIFRVSSHHSLGHSEKWIRSINTDTFYPCIRRILNKHCMPNRN